MELDVPAEVFALHGARHIRQPYIHVLEIPQLSGLSVNPERPCNLGLVATANGLERQTNQALALAIAVAQTKAVIAKELVRQQDARIRTVIRRLRRSLPNVSVRRETRGCLADEWISRHRACFFRFIAGHMPRVRVRR